MSKRQRHVRRGQVLHVPTHTHPHTGTHTHTHTHNTHTHIHTHNTTHNTTRTSEVELRAAPAGENVLAEEVRARVVQTDTGAINFSQKVVAGNDLADGFHLGAIELVCSLK